MTSIDPATYVPRLSGDAPEVETPPTDLPAYRGWPRGIKPGAVPLALTLGESEQAAVLLTAVEAYPTGVSMIVAGLVKDPSPDTDIGDPLRDRSLQLSVELPDGQLLSGLDPLPEKEHPNARGLRPDLPEDEEWEPDHAVLRLGGGGGNESMFEQEFWLWPLPTSGRLRIHLQWQAQGIGATVHEVDAQIFVDAAGQARPMHTKVVLSPPLGQPTSRT